MSAFIKRNARDVPHASPAETGSSALFERKLRDDAPQNTTLRGELPLAREFGLAHAAAAELVRLTQEASSDLYVAVGNLELGLGVLEAGNWERACGCLQLADAIDLLRPAAQSTRGLAEYRAGRHADGRMLSEQAMAMLETRSMRSYYEVHTYLARMRSKVETYSSAAP